MTHAFGFPDHWRVVRVDEAGRVQGGRQRSPKYQTGAHTRPYLRVANVFEDKIDTSDVLSMDFDPQDVERYELKPGDILLNEGQSPEWLGRSAIYRGEVPGACFQNTLLRFQANEALTFPEFAQYVFRFYMHTGKFLPNSQQTTNIAHLGLNRFAAMPFPAPAIAEQRRIVERLDALLTDLAAGERELHEARAKLAAYRAAVLRAACEGRLNPTTAELEAAAPRPHDIRGSGTLTTVLLPSIPSSWSWKSLGEIAEGTLHGPALSSELYGDDGVTVVRITDLDTSGRVVLRNPPKMRVSDEQKAKLLLRRGDILVARDASIGKCALYDDDAPAIFPNHIIRVRLDTTEAMPAFVLLCLQSSFGQTMLHRGASAGAGRASLKGLTLESFPMPVPSLERQKEILAEVDRRLSVVERLEASIDASLARAKRLRQAILKRAFEGKLVPQDPKDEPADAHLERVRMKNDVGSAAASRPQKVGRSTKR